MAVYSSSLELYIASRGSGIDVEGSRCASRGCGEGESSSRGGETSIGG
jgi:hypothetical protein